MTGTLHTAAFAAIGSAITGTVVSVPGNSITGTAERTLGDRFTDILNAKDFSAKGDGVTDDTANLQALLDAAFGPPNNPHGDSGKGTNHPVYIPPGTYIVNPPTALTVSNATRGSNASVTASASGTTMTVSAVLSGTVAVGQEIYLAGAGTPRTGVVIISGSGTTWTLSEPLTASSQTFTLNAVIVVTVNSTTNYLTGHTVTIAGATTTPANAINGVWGIAVIDATRFALRQTESPYSFTSYSNSGTVERAALQIRSARGVWIFGGAREATKIGTTTNNGSVIAVNGFDYGEVERLTFFSRGTGVAFDLNWDNTGSVALQGITFGQCVFQGTSTTDGVGLRIGVTGYQGSENMMLNCHWSQFGACLQTCNGNALQNTVVGGNFQSFNFGIKVSSGSVTKVISTGFQGAGTFDIQVDGVGSIADGMTIDNCRTESQWFVKNRMGVAQMIIGCGQTHASAGTFADFIGSLTMIGCSSTAGVLVCPSNNGGVLTGYGNTFTNTGDGLVSWSSLNQCTQNLAIMGGFDAYYWNSDSSGNRSRATFSRLPAASAMNKGTLVPVYDSSTSTAGATITGGGANFVMAYSNGTNWIVSGADRAW